MGTGPGRASGRATGRATGRGEGRTDELADAVRGVMRATRVTDVGDARRSEAIELLERARALLEEDVHPGPHGQIGWNFGEGPDAPHRSIFEGNPLPHQFFPYSPVVGPRNPLSPPLDVTYAEDRSIVASVTLDEQYNGPPWNLAHGGVIALLFDELLGLASIAAEVAGFTGRLTVHYRKPTPILEPLALTARVAHVSGRKTIATGEIRVASTGLLTAEAEGLFVQTGGQLADPA